MGPWLVVCALLGGFVGPDPGLAPKSDGPSFGFRFAETRKNSIVVTYVDPGGLARQMGLIQGDNLLEINGKTLTSSREVMTTLRNLRGRYKIVVERIQRTPGGEKSLQKIRLEGEIRESKKQPKAFYLLPDK
jgi:S1-C subfamily serine protease